MEFTDFFDYQNINEDHKAAVLECSKWIKNTLKDEYTAEKLLLQFKIKERKKIPVEESQFYHKAKQFGLFVMVQGHLEQENGDDGPFLAVNDTTQQLDLFLEWATKERMDSMTREDWKNYVLMEGSRPEELTEDLSTKLIQEEQEIQMMEEMGERGAQQVTGNLEEFRAQEAADEELMEKMIEESISNNEKI